MQCFSFRSRLVYPLASLGLGLTIAACGSPGEEAPPPPDTMEGGTDARVVGLDGGLDADIGADGAVDAAVRTDAGISDAAAPEDAGRRPATSTLLEDPTLPFPERFRDVGLYATPPDFEHVNTPAVGYAPRWALWSNGSHKERAVLLPEPVDNSDARWRFPDGTILFKTFLFENGEGTLRPVETRLLRRLDGAWEYAVYEWNKAGTHASLLGRSRPPKPVSVQHQGSAFEHEIPSRLQCRTCHESGPHPVLGFNELQLNAPVPGGSASQLERLAADGLLAEAPPDAPETVGHEDALTRQVLGYFTGNCVHCHNGSDVNSGSFDLRHDVALDNLIDVETQTSGTAAGIRVIPGNPEESILYRAVFRDEDDGNLKVMPPVGVQLRDEASVSMIHDWIAALDAQ